LASAEATSNCACEAEERESARDGQVVKAGDVLYRLDDRELRAQIARDEAALARDQAGRLVAGERRLVAGDLGAELAVVEAVEHVARLHHNDVRRVGELLSRSSASQAQFDVASAEAKVAAANVAATRTRPRRPEIGARTTV
jgi:multidrug efflux system membrane fusion protein